MKKNDLKEQIYITVIWGLVIVLALIPFFRVGFTTGDDLDFYMNRLQGPHYWLTEAASHAQQHGRFFVYLTKPFAYIPYLVDRFYCIKIVQYLSLLSAYGVFAYFVFKIFKSKSLSLILLLALITWMQITFNHHIPITAYPFSFPFAFTLCLCACLLFIRYTENARYGLVIWSAVLFFVTFLFYENYLLFAGAFGLYILIRNIRLHSLRNVFKTPAFYKEILPFCLAVIAYLIPYFIYRQYFASVYSGTVFAHNFSFSHFCHILWRCSTIMLPGMNFLMEQSTLVFNSPLLGGYTPNLFFALTHAPIHVYVLAVLTSLLFVHYMTRTETQIPYAKLIYGFVIAVACSFLSHTLVAATERLNIGWYSWMRGYSTCFYALFGMTLAIILALFGIVQLCRPHKWLHSTVVAGATGLMFVTVVLTGIANDSISREWQRSQNRFAILDDLAKSDYFQNIPDGSILYGPDLQHTINWGIHINRPAQFMERYLRIRSGKTYFYATTPEDLYATAEAHPEALVFSLNTGETVKACEMMLAVSAVGTARELQRQPVESWRAQAADIFYYSPTKDYVLFYTCGQNGLVVRDHRDTIENVAGLNRLRCTQADRRQKLTRVSLCADTPVLVPDGFSISNMLPETY